MFQIFKNISNKKKSAILILLILLVAITFETSQQLYYVKRFSLNEGVTFLDLLKTQSKSWLIWVLFSFPLVHYISISSSKNDSSSFTILKSFTVILVLVFLSIMCIATTQMILTEDSISFQLLWSEYIPFFIFQKALIFTLGYIAISIIMYYYFVNEQLLIKVEELVTLKKSHSELYQKLSKSIDDKASILNIKIGNKRKIIPVEHIYWIEADDYCVKVHTVENTYTMRSSLKALEQKLGSNFLRIHRRAIANMNKAKELNLSNSPTLTLENNTQVAISKSNLKLVKDFIS